MEPIIDAPPSLMAWDLVWQGGLPMAVIAGMLFWTLLIIFEKILALSRTRQDTEALTAQVRAALHENAPDEALHICQQKKASPFNRMLQKGLERSRLNKDINAIKATIEDIGELELFKLEKKLSILATLAGAAPMVGFLGTVLGMIDVFMGLHKLEGSITPQALSEGIYQAMVTTAGGLSVGIVAYIAYNLLVSWVSKIVYQMKQITFEFLDILQSPSPQKTPKPYVDSTKE
ncbi:MAG: MotA/TolQ/ExbB proton channel family protein [Bernardetiaceae bacterium]